jgi:conjugative transfer region protein TrbK
MRPLHDLKALIRLLAIAVLGIAVVAAVIRVRHSEDHMVARQGAPVGTSLAAQLAHCRSITPAQLVVDHSCERVWAENRKQFFASGESPSAVSRGSSIVSRGSAVSRALPMPPDFSAATSSARHPTTPDVAATESFVSAPPRKAAPQPIEQAPGVSRPDPSAAPGER